jgi:hypothetical protein
MNPVRPLRTLALGSVALLIIICTMVGLAGQPVASAAVSRGVKPDFVLSPHQAPITRSYTSALVNDPTTQAAGTTKFTDTLVPIPDPQKCRSAAYDALCDVYRIKVNRNLSPAAFNQVIVECTWDGTKLPDLALVAAGLGLGYLPDLDLFVYDKPNTYLDYNDVGGRGLSIPERAAWEATQDEYDLVVRSSTGATSGYKLTLWMSDEIFTKPFEALDQDQLAPAPSDHSNDEVLPIGAPSIDTTPPALALAPVDTDNQIAGVGLGTTEQFENQQALGPGTRTIASQLKPPSTLALVAGMVGFPFVAGLAVVLVMRRRRQALVA